MNYLIFTSKNTGQIEHLLSNSYQMPKLSDMGSYDFSYLDCHELTDKETYEKANAELQRISLALEQAISRLEALLLNPISKDEDIIALQENMRLLRLQKEERERQLKPFVDGEVTRDYKLISVEGGYQLEPSLNPIQPVPPEPPIDWEARYRDLEARLAQLETSR